MRAILHNRLFQLVAVLAIAMLMTHFGIIDHATAGAGGLLLVGLGETGGGSAFSVNPDLTPIAIGYRNTSQSLIGDKVLPEVGTGKRFKYTKYSIGQAYTVPDTKVGRRSAPNQVEFTGQSFEDEVVDYGLKDGVPQSDLDAFNAMPKPASSGPLSPMEISTMMTTDLILLSREVRMANLIFNAASYGASNQIDLNAQGNKKFTDKTSTPLDLILESLDKCIVRPNTLTIGRVAFSALRAHPQIVQAYFKTAQSGGIVPAQAIADLFELEQILIGEAWVNTAKKGQAVNLVRTWGPHCSFINRSGQAAQLGQPTFGFVAKFGDREVMTQFDKDIGSHGGQEVRVVERLKEVITAPEGGFYMANCA